jgi:hypothetical protein
MHLSEIPARDDGARRIRTAFDVLLVTATFDLDHALDDAAVALDPATGTVER